MREDVRDNEEGEISETTEKNEKASEEIKSRKRGRNRDVFEP